MTKLGLLAAIGFWGLIFFAFLTTDARGDFYSYTDSHGVIHLTNVPTSEKYRWHMPESGSSLSRKSYISYEDTIRRTSENYGVPVDLVRAIIKVESDFDPYAKSEDGAIGIMQLMPETARLMGVRNLYDPADNIEGGVRYLSHLLQRFESDVPLAVAAYNAGETAVVKYRSIPPFNETRLYVKKVLSYQKRYRNAGR